MANAPEIDGGGGAVTLSGSRDINLMRRAIIERWPVSPARMAAYMAALDRIIESSEDDRAIAAAVATLIAADRANVSAFVAVLKETQGPSAVTNNTQVNIDARGNQELVDELKKQIPLNDRIALLEKLESANGSNGNGKH